MKNKKKENWFCLCGILSIVFYLLHDIVGSINYPGYNWMSSAVSDLTATDAPSYDIANSFLTIYKIFCCLCCVLVYRLSRSEENKCIKNGIYLFAIMNFISAIAYALFPLTSAGYDGSTQSFIHVYIVTAVVVLLSIISLVMIAIGALKSNHKLLGVLSIIFLALMFIGAVGSQNVPKEIFGIFERFSTYSAVVFTGILGIYGFRKTE